MTQPNSGEPKGFGRWLRFTREQRQMSQVELAELVGRKQPTINKLEEGTLAPSSAICIQFAQVLDIPVGVVLAKAGMIDEATAICIQFAQVFDIPVEIILPKAGMIAEAQAPMEAKSLSKEALDIALRIDRLPAIERERLVESTQANLDVIERRLGKAARPRAFMTVQAPVTDWR